jgi:hypothetical protein
LERDAFTDRTGHKIPRTAALNGFPISDFGNDSYGAPYLGVGYTKGINRADRLQDRPGTWVTGTITAWNKEVFYAVEGDLCSVRAREICDALS